MKKFSFTLEKLHGYKNQVLDKEKNTLMQLRAEENAIVARIESLMQDFATISHTLKEATSMGTTMQEIQGKRYQLENIRKMQIQLETDRSSMRARIEAQLQVVIAATQEVEALDKLKEKQQEEYRYLETKAEEERVAELISGKIARQKINDA